MDIPGVRRDYDEPSSLADVEAFEVRYMTLKNDEPVLESKLSRFHVRRVEST